MKKIGLLGLVLCAAGAASAAATGWTANNETAFSSQNSTFTVAVAFTASDLAGDVRDLIYIGNKDTNQPTAAGSWAAVTTDGKAWKKNSNTEGGGANGWTASSTNSNGQWALKDGSQVNVLSGITDDKTHVIGITVTMTTEGNVNNASYDFYLDGQLLGSLVHNEIGDAVFSYGNFTSDVAGADEMFWTTGKATDEQWGALLDSLNPDPVDPSVPEPTALALLALGVAGVALRRRVA